MRLILWNNLISSAVIKNWFSTLTLSQEILTKCQYLLISLKSLTETTGALGFFVVVVRFFWGVVGFCAFFLFVFKSNAFHILTSLLIFLSYWASTSVQAVLLSETEDMPDTSGHSVFLKSNIPAVVQPVVCTVRLQQK